MDEKLCNLFINGWKIYNPPFHGWNFQMMYSTNEKKTKGEVMHIEWKMRGRLIRSLKTLEQKVMVMYVVLWPL
jgi:hypothetical protein